jgi:hypothetical protein
MVCLSGPAGEGNTTPSGYTLPTNVAVTGTYQWNAVYTSNNSNNANAGSANNLTNKTNAQVAAYCLTIFNNTLKNPYAQLLANALAVYAASTTLAGGNVAAGYGFTVSLAGTGAATYNIGSNGAAFGVANNTTPSVLQILLDANNLAVGGVLNGGNSTLQGQAQNVFSGINQTGDINS